MPNVFSPRLEILPTAQQRPWPELAETPGHFILYGDTAIALHLGHRPSVDFDFFTHMAFEPRSLLQELPYLRGAVVRQSAANTLTVTVDRGLSRPATASHAMKPLPYNSDLLTVAPRVIWFEPPEKALANPIRFLAYLMTYGTLEDIAVVRRYLDLDDFREALEHAPPGIIDKRSWAYWNAMIGRYPAHPCLGALFPTGHEAATCSRHRDRCALRKARYPSISALSNT